MANSSKIIINGQEYASLEEVPPQLRALYQPLKRLMADQDGNGIPDVMEGKIPTELVDQLKQAASQIRQSGGASLSLPSLSPTKTFGPKAPSSGGHGVLWFALGVMAVALALLSVLFYYFFRRL